MRLSITARHAEFSEVMKEYAREKAERLERYFDHLRKLEVILDKDGESRYSAEMIASAVKGQVLVCHSSAETAMAAVDSVHDKMERQLTRFKEKLGRKHGQHRAKFNRRRPELVAGDSFADLWW